MTVVFAGFEGESYADIPTVEQTIGLVPLATRAERTAELKEIADFANLMGVKTVGLHLGFVPHDRTTSEYRDVLNVTRDVCDYAKKNGQAIHLETGQEPADVLLAFLQDVERDNLFINFDPANMILYGCGEPIPALKTLGKYVRSIHCKDATWAKRPGEEWGAEVPLGEGAVGMENYLRTLDEIGYTGPLTIEREIPQDPQRQKQEIGHAVRLALSRAPTSAEQDRLTRLHDELEAAYRSRPEAAAKLLGLDTDRTAHALALSITTSLALGATRHGEL